ncbi:hypothetical protein Tco_0598869 [Tanacetum coccineum]
MDDLNITMEDYIRLEEEKALRRGTVYNWETAKYGKIWYDEDIHDLRSVEIEFPAIVFNDALTFEATPSCGPSLSPLNDNEIDFRISFDESDDEDYTVVFDENSFSYKIISVNNLKTGSENDNNKVNMPSFPSPKPEVSYFNDLDFFKDFENEYPAIVYNDALTSKSNFLTEHTISPQHINEFKFNNETSLSECDEKEQNVLYFNDLFPFNVIYPDDLKSDTDNDNDKIDIEQPSGDMSVIPSPNVINVDTQGSNKLLETSHDTSNKFFKTETFIKNLNVNIMTCNHLSNGMSFIFLIKNLYVPFGIPFDPKLFYKDGIKLGQIADTAYQYGVSWVILNGDGPIQVTTDENGVETEVPPKTAQALLQRQRERKDKSILLLAIPDEYQLRFHGIKGAKNSVGCYQE